MLTVTLRSGIKFRTLEKDEKIRADLSLYDRETPSHVTIRNWTLKIGYSELMRTKEQSDDWIILLDHSIQFGEEKIFAILGIQEKDFLKLNRPLQYTDLETLLIKTGKTWNGEIVSKEINILQKKLGKIKYAVGDYGSNLKKGLRLSNIVHIHDLSHSVSLLVKKIYKKDERYSNFKKAMSLMRTKFIQTDIASIVPPKSRQKSEYQSFDKIIDWSEKSLNLLNNTLKNSAKTSELQEIFEIKTLNKIRKELLWLNDYKELITELGEINKVIKKIEKDIKHNGFSKKTLENSKEILNNLESTKGKLLKDTLLLKLEEQFNLLCDVDIILASSDILESTFGKYKNRVSSNPMASITNLMLIIAAFTCNLSTQKINEYIESVKISDIKKWSNQEIGISLHKQRNVLLSV